MWLMPMTIIGKLEIKMMDVSNVSRFHCIYFVITS